MHSTASRIHPQEPRRRPIDVVLPRLDRVRATGAARWSARCPAHDDRGPSLSIREAGDGTILLHDFAGCKLTEIIAALGLRLSDLFPNAAEVRPMRTHGPVDVDRAVKNELRRILDREQEALGFRPATLSRHVAEARARVGRLLLRSLPAPPVRWWEVEPHCIDPAWRMFVLRAIEERAWRCNVPPTLLRDKAAANSDVADAILADATAMLRSAAAA